MRPIEVIKEAADELSKIAAYYDDRASGLGDEFIESFVATAETIRSQPDGFRPFPDGYRRCLMRRFPYGVFYRVKPQVIEIAAVVHLQSDPAGWRELLASR